MLQLYTCHSDIPPDIDSSGTFHNVPLLLSHVCPAAVCFDGYGDRWSRSEFLVRDGQDRRFSRESA
nr:MAG TPA: hypothetical protein [Caudoviricetes sp.]